MAITLDVASDGGDNTTNGATTTPAWNHTVSGSNTLLVVAVAMRSANGDIGFSSVTYNGVALTQIAVQRYTTGAGATNRVEQWYLKAAPTGTYAIVATLASGIVTPGGVSGQAASFNGADQTAPLDTSATGGDGGPSATLTPSASTNVLVSSYAENQGNHAATLSTTSGSATTDNNTWDGAAYSKGIGHILTASGSTTASWNNVAQTGTIVSSFKQFTAAAGGPPLLSLLGAGK